jgi:hypothetical protein
VLLFLFAGLLLYERRVHEVLFRIRKKEMRMKVAKWLLVLASLLVFVGCEKSDEEKLQDAAESAQKDAAKAIEGVKVPSLD